MITVQARNIRKEYQGRRVLDDLSINFQAAGLHAILGPNGSGKSTLLRLLALLEEPDGGDILLTNGKKIIKKTTKTRRKIVLVPDRQGLFNSPVLDNVRYGLRIRKIPKHRQDEIIMKVLNAVDLWKLRNKNSLVLSSGESQRLCLAMALAVEAQIILLDEPTSSLDPRSTAMVEKIILTIKEKNQLIVLVTHDVQQARRLADRVTFISEGKVKQQGSVHEFFAGYTPESY